MLGLDEFGLGFFIAWWDFVKQDLKEAAQDFFKGVTLPRFYTSYIILIPKVMDPTSFEKFKPISLCFVVY